MHLCNFVYFDGLGIQRHTYPLPTVVDSYSFGPEVIVTGHASSMLWAGIVPYKQEATGASLTRQVGSAVRQGFCRSKSYGFR